MALDFPASPITGQTYTGPGGIIWAWDGVKWVNGTQIGTAYAPIASPLFTGDPRSTTTPPPGDADTSLATTAFVAAAVAPAGNNAGRNLIHNATFTVAQRGTGPFTATSGYTADRWQIGNSADTASFSVVTLADADRAAIGDEAAQSALQNVFTGTATGFHYIQQPVENVRRLANKVVTASFWAKAASGTPKLGINIIQDFGNGGSPSAPVWVLATGIAVTLSTTWARYSAMFTIPSTAGKSLGTADDHKTALALWYSAGGAGGAALSGNIGQQSGTIQLWGVQLEVGTQATPLDYGGSPQQQLAQCQRFFQTGSTGLNMSTGSAGWTTFTNQPFPVQMRATPTMAVLGPAYSNCSSAQALYPNIWGFNPAVTITASSGFSFSFNWSASADL